MNATTPQHGDGGTSEARMTMTRARTGRERLSISRQSQAQTKPTRAPAIATAMTQSTRCIVPEMPPTDRQFWDSEGAERVGWVAIPAVEGSHHRRATMPSQRDVDP
jgi:hypothetical protein